jgi:hypothetical protein
MSHFLKDFSFYEASSKKVPCNNADLRYGCHGIEIAKKYMVVAVCGENCFKRNGPCDL